MNDVGFAALTLMRCAIWFRMRPDIGTEQDNDDHDDVDVVLEAETQQSEVSCADLVQRMIDGTPERVQCPRRA